jgi:GntR family transcriptional regulator, carbon starvation induced regulator
VWVAGESSGLMKNQSQSRIAESGPSPAISLASTHTLTEHVLTRLREDILSGQLAASQKLRVRELTARYGVGASPLREALARLTADGLVANESNRGFRVASVSVAEFLDVTENRKRIEGIALERSIEAGDDAWEGRVLADYHQLRKLEASHRSSSKLNDPAFDWERRHRNFHQALISACPSPWLLHFDRLLVYQFDRYRRMVTLKAGTTRTGREQEQALVDAALARDAKAASRILCTHIDDSAATILRQLRHRQ